MTNLHKPIDWGKMMILDQPTDWGKMVILHHSLQTEVKRQIYTSLWWNHDLTLAYGKMTILD